MSKYELIENKMVTLCNLEGFSLNEVTRLGKINESHVLEIENKYNISLPSDYKWFLSKYGSWNLDFEVLGILVLDYVKFQAMVITDSIRMENFPDNYIVIENAGEFQYCLNMIDGKIAIWERMVGEMELKYNDFLSYFVDRLNDCIDDIE